MTRIQNFWQSSALAGPPRIARAEGLHVWDESGRHYLDVTSGPVTVNLGHGNRRVLEAMRVQAERACFAYPTSFASAPADELAAELCAAAGPSFGAAFFVSSGSEAIEKSLQFARLHALGTGRGSRWKVIARTPSYHGSTLGALALSGDLAAGVMAPYLRESPRVPAPLSYRLPEGHDPDSWARHCLAELEATVQREGPETCLAVIIEPVIGFSAGAVVAPDFYYGELRRLCDRHGLLLIFDEIITGSGRTGRFLAAHHWPEARPDIVVLAKGLGSGYYPLGAFLAPAAMAAAVASTGGFHYGHTHKGSPLGCAVGLAVLRETLEQGLPARAGQTGSYLRARLGELMAGSPLIGDVRGRGLLNAVELVADPATRAMLPRELDVVGDIKALAAEQGLLIYGRRSGGGRYGDWIMVAPPLVATPDDVDLIVAGLDAALRAYADRLARAGILR